MEPKQPPFDNSTEPKIIDQVVQRKLPKTDTAQPPATPSKKPTTIKSSDNSVAAITAITVIVMIILILLAYFAYHKSSN